MSTSDTGQRLPIAFDDHTLQQLATDFSEPQLLWLSGYFYGRYAAGTGATPQLTPAAAPVTAAAAAPTAKPRITVLYGSQTGNSKKVAQQAVEAARQRGFEAAARDMNDYQGRELSKEQVLLLVVSTQGEGEPPVAAEELHQFLAGNRAPKLPELRYSVLALGDRSYLHFCQTGRDFDERLLRLGATALAPRVDCDVEFQADARQWMETVLQSLGGAPALVTVNEATSAPLPVEEYSRHRPLAAEVLEKIQLNGRGSTKETYHLELSLGGSGLHYEPGDALSVLPTNSAALVEEVLRATRLDASAPVQLKGETLPLLTALTERLELSTLSRDVLERYARHHTQPKLRELAGATAQLQTYLYGRDAADLLVDYPAELSAQQLVDTLRPLPARAYSISSSLLAHPDEVHLTVGAVRYAAHGRQKQGACSCYLADRVQVGDAVRVFVERNEYFKLPQNPDANIIMVGAGTGVAPFRSFVEERAERGAPGLNWLIFGNPHFTTDFLYQTEWQQHFRRGTLSKLHLAFSRDQKEKIYVHNRLLEYARDVYDWLESGAYLYVCGDKQRLAATVHKALVSVVRLESGASLEEAEAYVRDLKKQRRYLEDVY